MNVRNEKRCVLNSMSKNEKLKINVLNLFVSYLVGHREKKNIFFQNYMTEM